MLVVSEPRTSARALSMFAPTIVGGYDYARGGNSGFDNVSSMENCVEAFTA